MLTLYSICYDNNDDDVEPAFQLKGLHTLVTLTPQYIYLQNNRSLKTLYYVYFELKCYFLNNHNYFRISFVISQISWMVHKWPSHFSSQNRLWFSTFAQIMWHASQKSEFGSALLFVFMHCTE